MRARGLLLVLPLVLSGCLSLSWTRDRRQEPPPKGAIESLVPGQATLTDCLAALGAPLYLWEYKGNGAALAWGWADEDRKGLTFSIPVYDQSTVSLSYDDGREKLRGAVLLFGDDLVLEQIRRGWLRNLDTDLSRRRPAPVPAVD